MEWMEWKAMGEGICHFVCEMDHEMEGPRKVPMSLWSMDMMSLPKEMHDVLMSWVLTMAFTTKKVFSHPCLTECAVIYCGELLAEDSIVCQAWSRGNKPPM